MSAPDDLCGCGCGMSRTKFEEVHGAGSSLEPTRFPFPFIEPTVPIQGDECDCLWCKSTAPEMEAPEPACFVERDEHRSNVNYALGFTHGWVDCEAANRGDYAPRMGKRGLVNGFALASIVWALVALFVMACPAQQPITAAGVGPFNYGYVSDTARTYLEQGWDTNNAFQVERGYCIEPTDVAIDTTPDHANVTWRIHHVTQPERVVLATPYAISFTCSKTAVASMHIHTPTTCTRDKSDMYGAKVSSCELGGGDGALCSVDETDRTTARHDWFMVVQCGRGQFVWYWPGKRG